MRRCFPSAGNRQNNDFQLIVNIFGTAPRPETRRVVPLAASRPADAQPNYNEAAVFVGPSHSEGFCLTPPEAMMCGCAVACTDIGGYTVCCKHDRTALVSPVRNPERLAENIIRLIEDDDLRFTE